MKQVVKELDIINKDIDPEQCEVPRISEDSFTGKGRKVYLESYGCQMNFSDSEIVVSVMQANGFDTTSKLEEADLIFLNTCAIRENAEQKVRYRLVHFQGLKRRKPSLLVGVLGCMAERLKTKFLEEEKIVDLVAGPDAYRSLPDLVQEVDSGEKAINVFLSREETYADINPVRLTGDGLSAFISIMRGCDNMCSFCVVPYTRGRERSRDIASILKETKELSEAGYREVTLLGQNVDSYKWHNEVTGETIDFAQLLAQVALVDPLIRIRFSTSHPKDITDAVLHAIKEHHNICKYIHLPAQSGSSTVLERMNRTYDRDWYLAKIERIRAILGPDCGISTDMIAGFCGETEEEHQETLSLMTEVQYDYAYMYAYSERPGTPAAKKYEDNVSAEVKQRRLDEIITLQRRNSLERYKRQLGKVKEILVEGPSKKTEAEWKGRTTENMMVVFPRASVEKGQYIQVRIVDCNSATLFGEIVS
jgi:tRNA-2-methylthio-N6-dimethylallyladenosine synthase